MISGAGCVINVLVVSTSVFVEIDPGDVNDGDEDVQGSVSNSGLPVTTFDPLGNINTFLVGSLTLDSFDKSDMSSEY